MAKDPRKVLSTHLMGSQLPATPAPKNPPLVSVGTIHVYDSLTPVQAATHMHKRKSYLKEEQNKFIIIRFSKSCNSTVGQVHPERLVVRQLFR